MESGQAVRLVVGLTVLAALGLVTGWLWLRAWFRAAESEDDIPPPM